VSFYQYGEQGSIGSHLDIVSHRSDSSIVASEDLSRRGEKERQRLISNQTLRQLESAYDGLPLLFIAFPIALLDPASARGIVAVNRRS